MGALKFAALLCSTVLSAQPLIWFSPLDPILRPEVGYGGSPQYMQLFTPDAAWQTAASHVQVFKIYPQWLVNATDSDLQVQLQDLQRRGIALGVEFPMLSVPASCGHGVEGFGGDLYVNALGRIKALGYDVAFLAMDEPIYFATLYSGPSACGYTVQQAVDNAVVNIRRIKAMYPNIQIGDIEPFPQSNTDFVSQYAAALDAFSNALGAPLAFFHSDMDWNSISWRSNIDAMRAAAEARSVPFGIIYNGGQSDSSDLAWTDSAALHLTSYETGFVAPPDHVIFQSWNAWPQKLLPETDLDSFTALINRYFRARTTLTLSVDQGTASGLLSIGGDASVNFTATPLTGEGLDAQYTLTGITPAGVQQIVFGVRVNLECGCHGSADFVLDGFELDAADSSIVRDFSNGLAGWGVSDPTLVHAADGVLQVSTADSQPLLVNSGPMPFAASAGTPFQLAVTAKVNPASAGSGYFIVVFLGSKGEISRAQIPIRAAAMAFGPATTADDGGYQIALPPALAQGTWQLSASYAGSDDWWPSSATVSVLNPAKRSK